MNKSIVWAFGLSLLAGLAHAAPVYVYAGVIWTDDDAQRKCPRLCTNKSLYWTGTWHKDWGEAAKCICDTSASAQRPVSMSRPKPIPAPIQPAPPFQVQLPGGTVIRYDFTDFHNAGDLRNLPSPSFEGCANICIASPDCGAFTFAADQQRCYLKSGAGNLNGAPGGFSGVITSRAAAAR